MRNGSFILKPSQVILKPSQFILKPSWFILKPSWFILKPSWFILKPSQFLFRLFLTVVFSFSIEGVSFDLWQPRNIATHIHCTLYINLTQTSSTIRQSSLVFIGLHWCKYNSTGVFYYSRERKARRG